MADIFRAKIVDVEKDSLMVELTGNGSKVDAFLELLEGYEILELARTGITGLQRGIKDVTVIDQEGNINTLLLIYYNGQTVTHFIQTLN